MPSRYLEARGPWGLAAARACSVRPPTYAGVWPMPRHRPPPKGVGAQRCPRGRSRPRPDRPRRADVGGPRRSCRWRAVGGPGRPCRWLANCPGHGVPTARGMAGQHEGRCRPSTHPRITKARCAVIWAPPDRRCRPIHARYGPYELVDPVAPARKRTYESLHAYLARTTCPAPHARAFNGAGRGPSRRRGGHDARAFRGGTGQFGTVRWRGSPWPSPGSGRGRTLRWPRLFG